MTARALIFCGCENRKKRPTDLRPGVKMRISSGRCDLSAAIWPLDIRRRAKNLTGGLEGAEGVFQVTNFRLVFCFCWLFMSSGDEIGFDATADVGAGPRDTYHHVRSDSFSVSNLIYDVARRFAIPRSLN